MHGLDRFLPLWDTFCAQLGDIRSFWLFLDKSGGEAMLLTCRWSLFFGSYGANDTLWIDVSWY